MTAIETGERVIPADGHTIEPPDMWEQQRPTRFQDLMAKLVKDPKGGDARELIPGGSPMSIGRRSS
ncbi:MAG TPA: hypothetical protein VFF40_08675 [Acidimicrobiia bacterium]|nr:hypothetical protein [Acidimicrobiia bacterium]